MNQKIGDYVHYWRSNYLRSGINKLNEGTYAAYNFASQKERVRTMLAQKKQALSDSEMNAIKERLAYFLSTDYSGKEGEEKKILQDQIETELQKRFQENLGIINWNTGDVLTGDQVAQSQLKAVNRIGKAKDDKLRYVSTYAERIKGVQELISSGIEEKSKREELQARLDTINQELSDILNQGIKDIKNITNLSNINSTFYSRFRELQYSKSTIATQTEKISSVTKDLNKLLSEVRGASSIIGMMNTQKGALWEYINTYIKGMVIKNAEDELYTVTEAAVAGGDTQRNYLYMDRLSDSFDPSALGLKINEDGSIYLGSSQQKTDIVLSLTNEAGDTTKIVNASLKNANLYNAKNTLSLVSGTPFLKLLQYLDTDFVNHYLNLISGHGNASNVGTKMMEAREAIKMNVLWQALSGDLDGTQNTADIFIVNNNKSSGANSILVYDIPTLALKAMDNLNEYVKVTMHPGSEEIMNFYLTNQWHRESASKRIDTLLAELYTMKVSVGLSHAAVRENFNV